MRRAVIAWLLLAATVIGCVAVGFGMQRRITALETELQQLLACCDSAPPEELAALAQTALRRSAPAIRFFHCVAGHETVDALAQRLETLPLLAGDRAAFRSACAEAAVLLEAFRRAQRLQLENIL